MRSQKQHRQGPPPTEPVLRMPDEMKTRAYTYGVDTLDGYDAWAIFEASARGDAPTVRALLAKDPRLVNAQYWYQFPLHMAVMGGHPEIVRILLRSGADPGQSRHTYNSWDKLLQAARDRGLPEIESALEQAMTQRFAYNPGFEPLKESIIARDSSRTEELLRTNPDLINSSDALGNNAIHWSVLTRQLHLINRFVRLGAPIDGQRADGQTPALLAVNGATDYWFRATRGREHPSLRNHFVIVGNLLALGAKYTLSIAAAVGDRERVDTLLREDSGLASKRDSSRVSPLTYAAREGHTHIVRLLLEAGADPNAPEELAPHGRALFEACAGNHLDVAELLLRRGADPNAGADSSGCCLTICEVIHGRRAKPLQHLLRSHGAQTPPYAMSVPQLKQAVLDRDEVLQHEEFPTTIMQKRDWNLLKSYLDVDPAIPSRLDPRQIIAFPRSAERLREILSRGLDPNHSDWLGCTLLHACAERGSISAAALLLDAGASIDSLELEYQSTPLAAAVRAAAADPDQAKSRLRMARFLLQRGASPDLPAAWAAPLAWAIRGELTDFQTLLKRHGAR